MHLNNACLQVLSQLENLLEEIRPEDYCRKSSTLNGGTIAQHLRHTLEFFICLEHGHDRGLVNYDKRSHDKLIEMNKEIALATLQRVMQFVAGLNVEKKLTLQVGYDLQQDDYVSVETNVMRELIYNIEHAVHHMAIIKIALNEIAPYIAIPPDFGVAASTIRYNGAIASHGEE